MNRVIVGDCRAVLPTLPDGEIQCCVTSPPYWGLRDYGTGHWEGGDPECDHLRADWEKSSSGATQNSCRPGRSAVPSPQFGQSCARCGAVRIDGQLGLERTPDEYVATMVAVFREVKRVLRDDGTLWLNLGDSYAGTKVGNTNGGASSGLKRNAPKCRDALDERMHAEMATMQFVKKLPAGLKEKDLVGIPWRVAFALQADGWYLRSDIIWSKPNPMPESVTDRPTKAHEYVFLLSKAPRYLYDGDAIREPHLTSVDDNTRPLTSGHPNDGTVLNTSTSGSHGGLLYAKHHANGRNARSVWTFPTVPYAGAHFATFPPMLAQRCILAGSKLGSLVLDPFMGSGTVGEVAESLGRRWLGIEINPKYGELVKERTVQVGLPFEAPVALSEDP